MSKTDVVLGVRYGRDEYRDGICRSERITCGGNIHPYQCSSSCSGFFERLHKQAELLFSALQDTHNLVGVGLGAPNANYYKGKIEQPPNLSWDFVDVVGTLKQCHDTRRLDE